jgi:hypothetical protein
MNKFTRSWEIPCRTSGLWQGERFDIERVFSNGERRQQLDDADLLPSVWGKSRDCRRNKDADPMARSRRKSARPWRNRAMVYTLIEAGLLS